MRSYGKCTISAADVQAVATDWIQSCLQFSDYSRKCTVWVMLSVLLFAASRRRSVSEACQRLKDVPSDETFRKALWATLPPQSELEDRLNRGLGDHLPKPFFRRGQRVAVDFRYDGLKRKNLFLEDSSFWIAMREGSGPHLHFPR